jgi:L-ascorbate metabolism protein UlaG (beta-lactamase superfamily)
VLVKTAAATVGPEDVGAVDAVLLSHDQHPDNLDRRGREFTGRAPVVLSTPAAAQRLGGPVRGLAAWEAAEVSGVSVTAVPALHGPEGSEPLVGEVTGFVLTGDGLPTVYVSGDNASLDRVRAIAERFPGVDVAVLFAGAARTALLDGAALTLGSEQAAEAAGILRAAHVVPLHFEGWAHFSEGRDTLRPAFERAGLADRLHLLPPGGWWELRDAVSPVRTT